VGNPRISNDDGGGKVKVSPTTRELRKVVKALDAILKEVTRLREALAPASDAQEGKSGAIFKRLKSGEWGCVVYGDAPAVRDLVVVSKANGDTAKVIIQEVVKEVSAGAWLCEIVICSNKPHSVDVNSDSDSFGSLYEP
jgi:hypothetical protein